MSVLGIGLMVAVLLALLFWAAKTAGPRKLGRVLSPAPDLRPDELGPLTAGLTPHRAPSEEALMGLLANGPTVVGRLAEELAADPRLDSRLELAFPALVERLGPSGADAFAAAIARQAQELRSNVVLALQSRIEEMPLVGPALSAHVDASNATPLGESLGEVLEPAETLADLDRLGIAAAVAASRAEPERAACLHTFLREALESLDEARYELCLRHEAPEVRAAVINAVAFEEDDPRWLQASQDPDARVREAAVTDGDAEGTKVHARLTELARDPSPEVRAAVARELEPDDDVDLLEALSEDPDPVVALTAAGALGVDAIAQKVDEALASPEERVRLAGCAAARLLPDDEYRRVLRVVELEGRPRELAEVVAAAVPETLEALRPLAKLTAANPAPEVMAQLQLALSYNEDIPGAMDLVLELADRRHPPQVRRLAFEVISSERDGLVERIRPLLVPDDPQLADLLWALHYSFGGDLRASERRLFAELRKSPNRMLAAWAHR